MKRLFFKRRRGPVALERPEDLFVIRFDESVRERHARGPIARWKDLTLTPAVESEVSEDVRQGWAAAGWILVRAEPGSEPNLPTPPIVAPIFRTKGGSWWIGTDRITVSLAQDLSDSEAEEILGCCNLQVLRKLGFGKHLYEIKVEAPDETLRVASELADRPEVVYAEPQFLESLGPRQSR